MAYRIVPLKKAPDLQLEDTLGVRSGKSMDEAVSNLENAIKHGFVRKPDAATVIYIYPVANRDFEAVLTDNFQYVPTPSVIVKDRRTRERY